MAVYQRTSGRKPSYARIIQTLRQGSGLGSLDAANDAKATYIEIPFDCVLTAIGIAIRDKFNGNMQLGLYRVSNWGLIVATAVTAVAGLTGDQVNYIAVAPTFVKAGLYYVAVACDTGYIAATAGFRYFIATPDTWFINCVDNATINGAPQLTTWMAAAYPLPAVFVPAGWGAQGNGCINFWLEVTVV